MQSHFIWIDDGVHDMKLVKLTNSREVAQQLDISFQLLTSNKNNRLVKSETN